MTKFRKLSAILLGSLLAIGVGANIGASSSQGAKAAAGDTVYTMNLNAAGGAFGTSNTYEAKTGTMSSVGWKISLASCQGTGGSQVWVGGNSGQKAKMLLGTGYEYVRAAISGATATSTYYVAMVAQSAFSNVGKVTITPTTGGTVASAIKFYLVSSSSLTSNYTQVALTTGTQGSNLVSGSTTTFEFNKIASAYYALVFYGTNDYTVRYPTITFYEGASSLTLSSIAVTSLPTKTTYVEGENLNLSGLVVTGTYSDSSTANVTDECTFSPANGATLSTSNTSVTVSHTGVSNTSFNITVNPNTVPTIALDKSAIEIDNGSSDMVEVTPTNFSNTPTITAVFSSTGTATGTYATAEVNGMVVTVTGTAVGNDTLTITGTNGSQVDSEAIPVTVNALISGDWTQITSAGQLTEGKYIITAPTSVGGALYAMTNTNGTSGAPGAVALTWNGSVPSKTSYNSTSGTDVIWDITVTGSSYTIKRTGTSNYLYSIDNNNGLRVGSTSDTWTLTYDTSYIVMQEANNSRYVEIYNSADFRSYASITTGGQISTNADCFKMQFFKWTSSAPLTTSLTITGTLANATQYAGHTLDISGLTVTANYVGGDTAVLTTLQLNTLPTLVLGTTSYQISYTEGDITATGTINLTSVIADSLNSLSWTNRVTTYNEGQTLSPGTIKAIYGSGAETSLALADVTIYVYSGAWDPLTAPTIVSTTELSNFEHSGKTIRFGYNGVYSTTSTLTVNFVPTTTYGGGIATTATLVTDVSNLAVGDQILIVANTANYVMSATQGSNNRSAVAITKSGSQVTGVNSETMQVITLTEGYSSGQFGLYTGSAGYLCADSSSSNYLRTKTTLDANASFVITVSSNGVATLIAQGTYTRNNIQYNSGSSLFACYSSGQLAVSIYEMDSTIGGYNYDYLKDNLDGDYCTMDLAGLNLIYTRYTAMTENEIAHFNVESIVGLDLNTYTGLQAYEAAMARRASLSGSGSIETDFNNQVDESSAIAIITFVAILGVSAIGAFFYYKKKQA